MRLRAALPCALALLTGGAGAAELPDVEGLDGRTLMEEVQARHQQYPFVYEAQSLVLIDHRGDRSARRLERYSRVEEDGTGRMMLLFTSPPEVEGVALLATLEPDLVRDPEGDTAGDPPEAPDADAAGEGVTMAMYLPALGARLVPSVGSGVGSNFLGTDFTIESLTGEDLDDYRYARRRSREVGGLPQHVVDVFDVRDDPATARPVRRHFVRADNLFIDRTDHYDELGRVARRQTTHDLRPVDGLMWRGDMILMEDFETGHRSLLKIDRRIFSRDYVPAEMFDLDWLVRNRPPPELREAPEEEDPLREIVLREGLVRVEEPR